MKSIFTFLFIFCFSFLVAQPVLVWEKTFGGNGNEQLLDAVSTDEGKVVIMENSNPMKLVLLNENGESIRMVRHSYPTSRFTNGSSFTKLPDGGFLVGMKTEYDDGTGFFSDIGVVGKFDSELNFQDYFYRELVTNPKILKNQEDGRVVILAEGPTGYVFEYLNDEIVGGFLGGWGAQDFILTKDDHILTYGRNQISFFLYDGISGGGEYHDYPGFKTNSIHIVSDEEYLLVGKRNNDLGVTKINRAGEILWQKTFGGKRGAEGFSALINEDGTILVGGQTKSNDGDVSDKKTDNSFDIWLVLLDENGEFLWNQTYGGSGSDYLHSLSKDENGNFYVFGESDSKDGDLSSPANNKDIWILKFAESINQVDLGKDTTICAGQTIQINTGARERDYQWSNGDTTQWIEVNQAGTYSVTVTDFFGNEIVDEIKIAVDNSKVDLGGNQQICTQTTLNAGAFESYHWSTGATTREIDIQPVGEVWVQAISENSCVTTDTILVESIEDFNFTTTIIQPSCNDDSGAIELNFSNLNYEVNWSTNETSNSISNLEAGDFSVTLTNPTSGCIHVQNFEINQKDSLELSIQISSNCESLPNGGKIIPTIKNGTPPYSFQWSNGSFEAQILDGNSGIYSLTVTDTNNCQLIDSFEIRNIANVDDDIEWAVNYGGTGEDRANDLIQTSDGGYLVVGTTSSRNNDVSENKGGKDIWLVKLSPCGELEWEKSYGGSMDDEGIGVVEDSNGNFWVGGYTNSDDGDIENYLGEYDNIIIQTDKDGNLQWSKNFGTGFSNRMVDMVIKSDDKIIVTTESGLISGQTNHILQNYVINPNRTINSSLKAGPWPDRFDPYGDYYPRKVFLTKNDRPVTLATSYYRESLNIGKDNSHVYLGTSRIAFFEEWPEGPDRDYRVNDYKDGLENLRGELILVGGSSWRSSQLLRLGIDGNFISRIRMQSKIENIIQNTFGDYQIMENISNGVSIISYNEDFRSSRIRTFYQDAEAKELIKTNDFGLAFCGSKSILGAAQEFLIVKIRGADGSAIQGVTYDNIGSCGDDNGFISINEVFGGTPPYSYLWNTGDTTTTLNNLSVGSYQLTITDSENNSWNRNFQVNERRIESPLITKTGNDCGIQSGYIQIEESPHDAINPITYQWSNGYQDSFIDSLESGTYSLTIIDALGCELIDTFLIERLNLGFETVEVKPDCGNSSGFIHLQIPDEAVPPFDINWNIDSLNDLSINGLPQGEYLLEFADERGCTILDTFQIDDLELEFDTPFLKICKESSGEIRLTDPEDATPPFQYSWSNGSIGNAIDSLSSGIYLLEFSDSLGCSILDTFELSVGEPLAVDSIQIIPSCLDDNNGEIEFNVSGGMPPYDYLINGLLVPLNSLTSGIKNIEVIDSNFCSFNFEVFIPNSELKASISSTPASGNNNNGTATASPTGDFPPFSYEWNTDPIQTTQTAVNLSPKSYLCTITDSIGCSVIYYVLVDQTSNSNELLNTSLQIYPNPSSGEVHFEINQVEDWKLTITDTSGKLMQIEKGKGSKRLIINNLVAGVYLAKLSFGETFITKKLVIQP